MDGRARHRGLCLGGRARQRGLCPNSSCGGMGHFERDCLSRHQGDRRQQNNYASTSRNTVDIERLFVMQHMMSANVSKNGDNVWYADSGASNHVTSHGEWFKDLQTLEILGYEETEDDTSHLLGIQVMCHCLSKMAK